MNESAMEKKEFEIDVQRLLDAVLKKAWLIGVIAVVCAVVVLLGTIFLITPKYESVAMFYVNNTIVGENTGITSADIDASQDLVNSYIVILNTRTCLNEVIEVAGVDRDYEDLLKMINASAVDSTEIFQVVVTSEDPEEAQKIADAIAQVLPVRIGNILDGTSANVVEKPVVATEPSSPSYVNNTLIGFALGFLISLAVVVLREVFDVTIRSEEDITQNSGLPILAAVPDMDAPSKGGYYNKKSGRLTETDKAKVRVGSGVSFAASEAYKLLRTKVQFSFADENDCHVIGVSSSMAGEGKSTSAVNLAYTLAQLNSRVLLIDCDLRRPTVPEKLPINKMPGLTDFLTRQVTISDIIQICELDEVRFNVVSAGWVPPNPIELLSSERMEKTMLAMRKSFDYIILDLPPVGEVSDALVASKLADGILLVVRQNYCNRVILADTIQQFRFVNARVLGVVVSCAADSGVGIGKKYYKKYGDRYKYRYSRGYYGDHYATAYRDSVREASVDTAPARKKTGE